jgi:hypothetical protein
MLDIILAVSEFSINFNNSTPSCGPPGRGRRQAGDVSKPLITRLILKIQLSDNDHTIRND